jgi:hypothetical protein
MDGAAASFVILAAVSLAGLLPRMASLRSR